MKSNIQDPSGGSPRMVVSLMMALMGAMFFFAFLSEDVSNTTNLDWADVPKGLVIRYIIAMGLGGAIAGWLVSGLFGRSGVMGWLLAALGGLLATVFAGFLGSAVGLLPDLLADGWQMSDLIPIAFGLLVVPLSLVGNPLMTLACVVLVAVTHVWTKRHRV